MINRVLHHKANTIVRGVSRRGHSRATQRRYAKHVFLANTISTDFPENSIVKVRADIVLSEEVALGINPHDNDPLVITV